MRVTIVHPTVACWQVCPATLSSKVGNLPLPNGWHSVSTRSTGFLFFSSRRRHTRSLCDWSSDVCSSDLSAVLRAEYPHGVLARAARGEEKRSSERRDPIGTSARSPSLRDRGWSRQSNAQIGRASCRERV